MTKIFPNLINLETRRSKNPNTIHKDTKQTVRSIVVKLLKICDNEKIVTGHYTRREKDKIIVDLLSETLQARGQ